MVSVTLRCLLLCNLLTRYLGLTERKAAKASGGGVHPPSYPWDFNNIGTTLDANALRRGWYVYQKVSTCAYTLHSPYRIIII